MKTLLGVGSWSLLVVLLIIGSGCGTTKHKLRMVPELETAVRQVTTMEQDMTMSLGPMGEQSTESKTVFEMTQTPRERREDGSTVMDYRYDRIRSETRFGDEVVTMDTDTPDESAVDPFASLVGMTITARITERGEVLEVSGFDKIVEAASAGLTGPEAEQMWAIVSESFGDEAMTSMLQQVTPILPEEAVGVGDSWASTTKLQFPILGEMGLDYSYEVEAFEPYVGSDCVKLGFEFVISIGNDDGLRDFMRQMIGMDIDLEWNMRDSAGTGSLWLDQATGVVLAMDFSQDISVQMSMSIPDMVEGMDMEFDIIQSTMMETIR